VAEVPLLHQFKICRVYKGI